MSHTYIVDYDYKNMSECKEIGKGHNDFLLPRRLILFLSPVERVLPIRKTNKDDEKIVWAGSFLNETDRLEGTVEDVEYSQKVEEDDEGAM